MNKILKLTEFSKEEIQEQINQGIIDNDFVCDYISEITKVYNLLIDEIERLEEENEILGYSGRFTIEVGDDNE